MLDGQGRGGKDAFPKGFSPPVAADMSINPATAMLAASSPQKPRGIWGRYFSLVQSLLCPLSWPGENEEVEMCICVRLCNITELAPAGIRC